MPIQFRTRCRKRSWSEIRAWITRALPKLLISAVFLCDRPLLAISPPPASLEYEIEAAFLFNFTKFVEWPSTAFASANAPFTICILGDDPFGRTLDDIVQGESVNGHKIAVERIQTDQQKSCQVLYISNSKAAPASLSTAGSAVLTVGDGPDFTHQGGIIGFVIEDRRVRFDINLKTATNAGLKLSSRLLSVARYVEK